MGKIKAWIVGGDAKVERLLESSGVIETSSSPANYYNLNNIDMIVFTGGEDVHPEFYGQSNVHGNWLNTLRDQREIDVFMKTKDTHYHFGICRGLQLLAVLNGCKLWQNVTGHQNTSTHTMNVIKTGSKKWKDRIIDVTSVHHQAIMVDENIHKKNILAYSQQTHCSIAKSDNHKPVSLFQVPEAAWFEETKSFGVQGHPEYTRATEDFKEYVLYHLIEDIETGYYANAMKGHA